MYIISVCVKMYKSLADIPPDAAFIAVSNSYRFSIYDSAQEFAEFIESLSPEDRQYHEVIRGTSPQKIKFDIDASVDALSGIAEDPNDSVIFETVETGKVHRLVAAMLHAMSMSMLILYQIPIDQAADILVCQSARPATNSKYSYHLIMPNYCVKNNKEANHFARQVYELIDDEFRPFVDMSVYKKTQNFRAPLCHKGDGRYKQLPPDACVLDALITHCDTCTMLPERLDSQADERSNVPEINDEDLKRVLEIVEPVAEAEGCIFRGVKGNTLLFTRYSPAHCTICDREHEGDAIYFTYSYTSGGYCTVNKKCWRAPSEKYEFVDTFIGQNKCTDDNWREKIVRSYINATEMPKVELFNLKGEVYDEPDMRAYPHAAKTLLVKAGMGLGKTKKLVEYIDTHVEQNERLIFLAFRRTFAREISKKVPHVKFYGDIEGPLVQNRLVVQIESLKRLQIGNEPPEYTILDDCESIFEQMTANLAEDLYAVFAKFYYLVRYSQRLILMDAALSSRTINILDVLRPGWRASATYVVNTYFTGAKNQFNISVDEDEWLNNLVCDAKTNRIVIASSSIMKAKHYYALLSGEYEDKKILLYTSETSEAIKREHFSDISKQWDQADIVIYTPTISAGISYENERFDKYYAYFIDLSCGVQTCMQMLWRVRNISTREYNLCLITTGNNLPTTHKAVVNNLLFERGGLGCPVPDALEFDENGVPQIRRSPFLVIWIENLIMANRSKNYFISEFMKAIKQTGAKTAHLELSELYECKTAISYGDIIRELCEEIASARELEESDAESIRRAIDKPLTDIRALEKYDLRETYRYRDKPIDADWVDTYRAHKVQTNYKNLADYTDGLAHMSETDRLALENNYDIQYGKAFTVDLFRTYKYSLHHHIILLLRLYGWTSITDTKLLSIITVGQNCSANRSRINSLGSALMQYLGLRAFSESVISTQNDPSTLGEYCIRNIANKILDAVYGAQLKSGNGLVRMQLSLDFSYEAESDSGKPKIILKPPDDA